MNTRIAIAAFLAALSAAALGATGMAAQAGAAAPAKAATRSGHGARAATPPLVIPEQFAPPQEAYASMPEASTAAPVVPSACQARLAKIAVFRPLPVLVGPGDCGATDAVVMDSVILSDQTKVAVTPAATMRCAMAEAVAHWLREDVVTILKDLPPLRVLDNFDSYSCRGRNNVRAAQLSEHGRADALDVRDFKLADGHELNLTDINAGKKWREAIKESVCTRFSTVLGPGSDGYHEEHVHLDLEERRNNYKICEWDVRVLPPVEANKDAGAVKPTDEAAATAEDNAPQAGENAAIPSTMVPLPRPRPAAADAKPRAGRKSGRNPSYD